PLTMDNLTYEYYDNSNQLRKVADDPWWAGSNWPDDIDHHQSYQNYEYDKIGNLIKDTSEEIAQIVWTHDKKVKEIIRTPSSTKPNLEFRYDATGNRTIKIVKPVSGNEYDWEYIYYIRNASGDIIQTYNRQYRKPVGGDVAEYWDIGEQNLFGSKRLGILKRGERVLTFNFTPANLSGLFGGKTAINTEYPDAPQADEGIGFVRGNKRYEFANHLGNVIGIFSDRKVAVNTNGHSQIDLLLADVHGMSDYFPFGMQMPGRSDYVGNYRYGFNGKENDKEWGTSLVQDYGFRLYNPAVGKFLSVDPLTKDFPMLTPYQYASNRPIDGIDLDGLEYYYFGSIQLEENGECYFGLVHTQDVITIQTGIGPLDLNLSTFGIEGTFVDYNGHWRLLPAEYLNYSLNNITEEEWNSFTTIAEIEQRVQGIVGLGNKAETAVAVTSLADGLKNILKGGFKFNRGAVPKGPGAQGSKKVFPESEGRFVELTNWKDIVKALKQTFKRKPKTIEFVQGTGANAKKLTTTIPDGYKKVKVKGAKGSVYSNGKDWISPDLDGHNGGVWKRWTKESNVGSTSGRETLDGNLKYIKE
ncbi:MAG: RHS repeat-associated core domain-containing protein, partial [Bacteroidota bacterium]